MATIPRPPAAVPAVLWEVGKDKMMTPVGQSRRRFLGILIGGAAGMGLLSACGGGAGTTGATSQAAPSTAAPAVTTARSTASVASSSAAPSTATSAATRSAAASAQLASGKADLTMIYWGGTQDKETNNKIVDQYTAAHPDIKVTVTLVADKYDDKLQAMVAGGTPPDIFEMAEAFVGYAARGVVQDLNSFIKQTSFDMSDFYPKIVNMYTYKGQVGGIPPRGGPMGLFYNKDVFSRLGVPFPQDGWSWDDFIQAATKLTTGSGTSKTYGIGSGTWWPWWMSAVYQNGGTVLNADKTQATLDTDAAIGGLQWFGDWFNKYHIAPNADEQKTLPKGGNDQWMIQGSTGMNETGFWMLASNDKVKGLNWAVTTLPKGKVGASVLFSNAWCLTAEGKQHAAAFDLVRALTSKDSETIISQTRQDMPTRKSVLQSPAFKGDEPADHTAAFIASEDYVIDMPITPQWSKMLSGPVTGELIGKLVAGTMDASTAGKQMTERINTVLKG